MRPEIALRIGEVARRTQLSPDTLRHYERKGLLPRAQRSPGGYRLFGLDAERRVRTVQAALALGFTLDELGTVLRERARGRAPCRQVRALAGEKLRLLDGRIAELTELRSALAGALTDWDARLARTPPGAAAGLLEALAVRVGPSLRSRPPLASRHPRTRT